MKTTRLLVNTALTATLSLLVLTGSAQSVPNLVNYQGRLTDQTGAALAAGNYGIQFRVWDAPTASGPNDLIWAQQIMVPVQTNGAFNVILGSGTSIPGTMTAVSDLSLAFATNSRYLGVTVASSNGVPIAGAVEILPRQQLLSVPFAVQALQAQQAQQAQVAQQTIVATNLAANLANALCPPGSVMAYMGTTAPPGWLLCDGSAVSRSTYATLFAAVGTASGSGDGSTTFNVPDFRGMFLRGVDGSAGRDPDKVGRTAANPGGNSGPNVGSSQPDNFKAHTHIATGWNGTELMSGGSGSRPQASQPTSATGGNETRPKNVYVNYIIKY